MFNIITKKQFTAVQTENALLTSKLQELNDVAKDNKTLLTRLEESENEVANLKNMSKDMTEEQLNHNTSLADMKATCDAAIASKSEQFTKELTECKAAYDKQISDLQAQLALAKTSSEERAISIMARVGVPLEELPKTNVEILTPKGCWEKWQSLLANDKAAADQFYNTNRAAIKSFVGYKG